MSWMSIVTKGLATGVFNIVNIFSTHQDLTPTEIQCFYPGNRASRVLKLGNVRAVAVQSPTRSIVQFYVIIVGLTWYQWKEYSGGLLIYLGGKAADSHLGMLSSVTLLLKYFHLNNLSSSFRNFFLALSSIPISFPYFGYKYYSKIIGYW